MSEPAWRPTASLKTLRQRARVLAALRGFFAARGVLEVETPILGQTATPERHIVSFVLNTDEGPRFLHSSPEFAMKRLLAAGSQDIYQIGKVFRAGEIGTRHNPEFTLVEWYRVGLGLADLMAETVDLVGCAADCLGCARPPTRRLSYRQAFQTSLGLDPFLTDTTSLVAVANRQGLAVQGELDREAWLDILLEHCVIPQWPADALTLLSDYPPARAALARLRQDAEGQWVAARFELYWGDHELANGFHELCDAPEQAGRFAADRRARAALGLPTPPSDERFLAALGHGLPDCAGVALGLDRLLMVLLGHEDIAATLTFPWARA